MRTRSRLRSVGIALVAVLTAALFTFAPAAAQAADTATISGKVTVPSGVSVSPGSLTVNASGVSTGEYKWATVSADGTYTISGVAAGDYKVKFSVSDTSGLAGQWWKNQKDWSSATILKVTAGANITGIDAKLERGATIKGTFTVPAGVEWPSIRIVDAKDRTRGVEASWQYDQGSKNYTLTGVPAGSYKIAFSANGATEQWWNKKTSFETATTLTVKGGDVKTGINASLVKSAVLKGKVTLPAGIKLTNTSGLYVAVYSATKEVYLNSTSVKADGTYRLENVPAGTYKVNFSAYGLNVLGQWWNNTSTWASAAKVKVTAGQTRTLNAKLVKGAVLSGKVTLPKGSGTTLKNVEIGVFTDKRVYLRSTWLSASGTYRVDQLPAGSYKVRVMPNDGTAAGQWYKGKSDWKTATKIALKTGATRTNVDFSLKPGGSISGTVSGSAAKKGVAYVYAYRLASDGEWEYSGWALAAKSGSYKIKGLQSGKYAVQFYRAGGGAGSGSATAPVLPAGARSLTPATPAPTAAASVVWEKWYKDKPDAESATRVTVKAPKNTGGINTNLDVAPKIQTLKTSVPKISGTLQVGKKLTAKPGTWTRGATLRYQWYAGGKAIAKATKSTFTLTKSQKGKTITVKVTGKKDGYKSASKTSKKTKKVS